MQNPTGHCWSMTEKGLVSELMTQAPAPKELTELTVYMCKQLKCSSRACKCFKAGLSFSPACGCENDEEYCQNRSSLENLDQDIMSNVSSDSD